jgi:Phytanoyl-CoA dioxygenase (PhyH)
MSLWKWKRTSRLDDRQPAAAIRSSRTEAGTSEVATVSATPVDIAVPHGLPSFTLPPDGVSLGRSFCQDGFVVVPQVFDQTEIAELRRATIAQFPDNRPPFEPKFSGTALFQEPFRLVFLNRKFIQALRTVLGEDFVFVNEFALHDSLYAGWHTDTVSPDGKGGHEFHWSPGFCVVQNAIYLQDNNENGGGLDVVPGSHMRDDTLAAMLRRERGFPVFNRMPDPVEDPRRNAVSIPSRAGDVVMFHFRLSHRASPHRREAQNNVDRKLAMFMVAGPNNAQTRRYRAWLDEYDQMNGTTHPVVPDDFRSLLSGIGHTVI